jgi:hypothetical protein
MSTVEAPNIRMAASVRDKIDREGNLAVHMTDQAKQSSTSDIKIVQALAKIASVSLDKLPENAKHMLIAVAQQVPCPEDLAVR